MEDSCPPHEDRVRRRGEYSCVEITCNECGVLARKRPGLCSYPDLCYKCGSRKVSREYRAANKDRISKNKLSWNENNKDRNKEVASAWYESNKGRATEKNRKYREEHKEKLCAYSLAWYYANKKRAADNHRLLAIKNKALYAENARVWGIENKDLKNKLYRDWCASNPEKKQGIRHRRRARLINAQGAFPSPAELKSIYLSSNGTCFECGCTFDHTSSTMKMTIGHMIPLDMGGSNFGWNLRPQCQSCNSKQGSYRINTNAKPYILNKQLWYTILAIHKLL